MEPQAAAMMAPGTSAMPTAAKATAPGTAQKMPKSERRKIAAADKAAAATAAVATEAEDLAAYLMQLEAEEAGGPAASMQPPRGVVEAFMREVMAAYPA